MPCHQCAFVDASYCGTWPGNDDDHDHADNGVSSGSARRSTELRCLVEQRYTEGSGWTAYEVNDIISLLPTTTTDDNDDESILARAYEASIDTTIPFTFGCQTSLSGLFQKQFAHGILGLERYSFQSLPQQLQQHGITNSTAFSLCLSATRGFLGLGGAMPHTHYRREEEIMQFTPLARRQHPLVRTSRKKKKKKKSRASSSSSSSSGMYAVSVEQVWLGDTLLTSREYRPNLWNAFHTGRGTILDSGTTDTYLPAALGAVWDHAWADQTGRHRSSHGGGGAKYSRGEFQALPTLHLVLAGNVTVSIPAAHYMEGAASVFAKSEEELLSSPEKRIVDQQRRHVLTLGIHTSEPRGAVLGINAMLGYDILFDAENARIGFAPANCDDDDAPVAVD